MVELLETNGNEQDSSHVVDTDDSLGVGSTSGNHQETLVRAFHVVVEPEQNRVDTVQGDLDLDLVVEGVESADVAQVRAIQDTERVTLTSGIAEYYCRRCRSDVTNSLQCQWPQSDGSRA